MFNHTSIRKLLLPLSHGWSHMPGGMYNSPIVACITSSTWKDLQYIHTDLFLPAVRHWPDQIHCCFLVAALCTVWLYAAWLYSAWPDITVLRCSPTARPVAPTGLDTPDFAAGHRGWMSGLDGDKWFIWLYFINRVLWLISILCICIKTSSPPFWLILVTVGNKLNSDSIPQT